MCVSVGSRGEVGSGAFPGFWKSQQCHWNLQQRPLITVGLDLQSWDPSIRLQNGGKGGKIHREWVWMAVEGRWG